MTWSWSRDDFDQNGKLILLYRHQRFLDEEWVGEKVLDIGGWGKIAHRLSQDGHDVQLLDIDKLLLGKSRARFQGFETIQGDAQNLPFKNEVFDTVHCSETLEHVRSAEDVVRDVFMVLKKNGTFCGTVPLPNVVHKTGEEGIRFFSNDELREIFHDYKILKLEETPSISPSDHACSIIFVCRKEA